MAVLDTDFRVRGVQGLRVVDASVYPRIPGTFTAVSTYLVGEKAADVILQEAAKNPIGLNSPQNLGDVVTGVLSGLGLKN
jgi:choline dehydrogenase-like flavoprotein